MFELQSGIGPLHSSHVSLCGSVDVMMCKQTLGRRQMVNDTMWRAFTAAAAIPSTKQRPVGRLDEKRPDGHKLISWQVDKLLTWLPL